MPVLLGFKDKSVKSNDQLDFTVNKIGGLPDWMSSLSGTLHPKCKLCDQLLHQIVQVYCPLVGSTYHRTLYIFGCSNKYCWNKQESFTLLRCQKLEDKVAPQKAVVSTDSWGTNEWFDDDDFTEYNREKETCMVDEMTPNLPIDVVTQCLSEKLLLTDKAVFPPEFDPYYVYVMDEKDTVMESAVDYEMQLYKEYVAREGELSESADKGRNAGVKNAKGKNKKKEQQQEFGDGYEKVNVKHGDQKFYHFQKRIQHCPEQCLRYEWKGEPLILSNISQIMPPFADTPPCSNCKAPRVFEMQLMPNLVICLHEALTTYSNVSKPDFGHFVASNGDEEYERNTLAPATDNNHNSNVWNISDPVTAKDHLSFTVANSSGTTIEFGCLYIYTCSQSCWKDSDVIVEEHIALQLDPESNLLT